MEINEEDFLQELLALRRSPQTSSWDSTTSTATFSTQMSHNNNVFNNSNNFISSSNNNNNVWSTTPCFSDNNNQNSFPIISSSSWDPSVDPQSFTTNHLTTFNQVFYDPAATFAADQLQDHHHTNLQFCSSAPPNMMEDETASFLIQQDDFFCDPFSGFEDHDHCHHQVLGSSLMDEDQAMMMMMMHSNQGPKIEPAAASSEVVPSMFNVGCGGSDFLDRKSGKASKKVQGQPSKNLMAERRRRKRLNDRLSMLRSIVPKISKMDRTSIVGDTIDYMKELLERIQRLQEELDLEPSHDEAQLVDLFKDLKPNEMQIRNTPKFEVKRRNMKDMRVEIRCSGKPGLLLSTVNTMETLGLEIEQCVISCFNEFEMHASCSEDMDQRNERDCDEIKDALFRNAGYGGRCL